MQSFLSTHPRGRAQATYPSRVRPPKDGRSRTNSPSVRLKRTRGTYMVLLRIGFVDPAITDGMVSSYLAFSPLSRTVRRTIWDGIVSVTLSVAGRLRGRHPPVRRYPVLRSSDFPPRTGLAGAGRLRGAQADGTPGWRRRRSAAASVQYTNSPGNYPAIVFLPSIPAFASRSASRFCSRST